MRAAARARPLVRPVHGAPSSRRGAWRESPLLAAIVLPADASCSLELNRPRSVATQLFDLGFELRGSLFESRDRLGRGGELLFELERPRSMAAELFDLGRDLPQACRLLADGLEPLACTFELGPRRLDLGACCLDLGACCLDLGLRRFELCLRRFALRLCRFALGLRRLELGLSRLDRLTELALLRALLVEPLRQRPGVRLNLPELALCCVARLRLSRSSFALDFCQRMSLPSRSGSSASASPELPRASRAPSHRPSPPRGFEAGTCLLFLLSGKWSQPRRVPRRAAGACPRAPNAPPPAWWL